MNTKDQDKDNTQDSSAIKKEVEATLDQTEQDFERLEQRATPGYFVDQVIYANRKRHPRDTLEALAENPVASSFLAIGTLLLSKSKLGQSGEDRVKDAVEQGKEAIREASSRVKEASQNSAIESEISPELLDESKTNNISPLLLASVGLGIGASLGAALPEQAQESEWVDRHPEQLETLYQDIREAISQSVQNLKECVMDEVKSVL